MPIPKAIAKLVLGAAGATVLNVSGMVAHFAYGGVAGSIFTTIFDEQNLKLGLVWGGILWVIMQVAVLPVIGWGFFGLDITGGPP